MTTEISRAQEALRRGGLVVYPTSTLFGVGGDARIPGVVDRVARLKGRGQTSPFLVLVKNIETAVALAGTLPAAAVALMERCWPGDLTLLLPASPRVPSALIGPTGLVGVRIPTHPVPQVLVDSTGAWLVSTSANLTGQAPPIRLADVAGEILKGVDATVDGPPNPGGAPSTIVAVPIAGPVRIIRAGAIPEEAILNVLQGLPD